jgi:hypothetical protein
MMADPINWITYSDLGAKGTGCTVSEMNQQCTMHWIMNGYESVH